MASSRPYNAIHPLSVIKHPRTGEFYLVVQNFMTPSHDFHDYAILPIEQHGHYKSRSMPSGASIELFSMDVKEQMGLEVSNKYFIIPRAQSFNDVFKDYIGGKITVMGRLHREDVIGKLKYEYRRHNEREISTFYDLADRRTLVKGRSGTQPNQRDGDIVKPPEPVTTPPDATTKPVADVTAFPLPPETTDTDEGDNNAETAGAELKPRISASISAIASRIPARRGAHAQQPAQRDSGSVASSTRDDGARSISDLSQLGELFAARTAEQPAQIDASQITLLEAVQRTGYNLSDLTMAVIAGEVASGVDAPQWQLKDSAPKTSPFRGQSLNLQNVFTLFANEEITADSIAKSIHFAGKVTSNEIVNMVRDPEFRAHFAIK